jgi:hypothetical protein
VSDDARDTIRYTTGLDVGPAQDFTAIAVLERTKAPHLNYPNQAVTFYAVRHLQRFSPGTPYAEIAAVLAKRFGEPPLYNSSLAVDITGVGRPVVDLLRKAKIRATVKPITVTGGHGASRDVGGGWHVPRKELVSTMQVLLQERRLKVAQALPEAATLQQELLNFKAKPSTAPLESFEAWRENPHDDLVLAIAIAAWVGERAMLEFWVSVYQGPAVDWPGASRRGWKR